VVGVEFGLVVWSELWIFPDILFYELDFSCDVDKLVKGRLDETEAVYFFL
jgi:hypothetical protein